MPNYAAPFESLGSAAGGAAGAAGGGILGTIGGVLDSPRQALWNLIRSGKNAITGEGTWDDALRAVPGALGAGLGAALTATGVGAPLGILAGSALGGLGQSVGSAADADRFRAPTAEDVTGSDNPLLNTLVSMGGDPLTYAGGFGGASRGAKAGKAFGTGLEDAAAFRGLNYGADLGKLDAATANYARVGDVSNDLLSQIRSNPQALNELAPGSVLHAHGNQTAVFRTPQGHMVSFMTPEEGIAPLTRPDIPEMLQAERSRLYGNMRVEHSPALETAATVAESGSPSANLAWRRQYGSANDKFGLDISGRGLDYHDPHLGQIGVTPSGSPMILDPGAISGGMGVDVPRAAESAVGQQPSAIQSALLRLLGSDSSMRNELQQGLQTIRGGSTVLPTLAEQAAPIGQRIMDLNRQLAGVGAGQGGALREQVAGLYGQLRQTIGEGPANALLNALGRG
jgi:hypothetical protein